jgi:hypothetical protein
VTSSERSSAGRSIRPSQRRSSARSERPVVVVDRLVEELGDVSAGELVL